MAAGSNKLFLNLKAALVDLSGTLHVEDRVISGVVDALRRLKGSKIAVRFVTNTSKESRASILDRLRNFGLDINNEELFTSLTATRRYVEKRCLRPLLLLEPSALQDFDGVNCNEPNAVVVGLAPSRFSYESMNTAFRCAVPSLVENSNFSGTGHCVTIAVTPSFHDARASHSLTTRAQSDSEISLDVASGNGQMVVERGYTSDSELELNDTYINRNLQRSAAGQGLTGSGSWILIGKEGEIETFQVQPMLVNQYDIFLEQEFIVHDGVAFFKSCESLAFLIRDGEHITPANLERCVHCVRVFAEASLNGGKHIERRNVKSKDGREKKLSQKLSIRRSEEVAKLKKPVTHHQKAADDGNDYHQVSIQLLDLMHTLHTRASSVIEQDSSMEGTPAERGNLWFQCWCPILQGIARMCCDNRRTVRSAAMTYLQRALLVHDLQKLTPVEWESCFNKVLFPLLAKLLENVSPSDPAGLEETRMRGATLLCKVFLQHLNPLLTLSTFAALWLTILDFMDKYMHSDKSDLLCEAIPESLKNMLLVMDTAGIFGSRTPDLQLWNITWDRIGSFLPGLRDEVFKPHHHRAEPKSETVAIDISDGKSSPADVLKSQQSVEDCNTPRAKLQHSEASGSPTSPLSTDSTAVVGASIILQPPLSTDVVSRPTLRTMTTASASLPILLNTCIIDTNHVEMTTTKQTLVETGSATSRIPQ